MSLSQGFNRSDKQPDCRKRPPEAVPIVRKLAACGYDLTNLFFALIAVLFLACPLSLTAQDFDLGGEDKEEAGADDLEGLIAEESNDLDLLRLSHFSELHRWKGVEPPKNNDDTAHPWKVARRVAVPPRVLISPQLGLPIHTQFNVPEDCSYRVWLSYETRPGQAHPVQLSLKGANTARHLFGRIRLEDIPGAQQEQNYPIRFEDDSQRIAPLSGPVVIWEYVDLKLKAGTTRFEISSTDKTAKLDALFICASKVFSPSKSPVIGEGNIYRTWCRMRVAEANKNEDTYSVSIRNLTYHWRRTYKGHTEPLWYVAIGRKDKKGFTGVDGAPEISVGDWTRWIEITEDVANGPWARGGGPWATGFLGFKGVIKGTVEIQLAWHPHEAAVLKTIRPGLLGGSAVCMVPLDAHPSPPIASAEDKKGSWGIRRKEVLDRFETAMDVHKRHFQWAEEAVAALDLETPQTPKKLLLYTPCGAAQAARESCLRMLAKLGLNGFYDYRKSDVELSEELGFPMHAFIPANDSQYLCWTHDPLDPVAERNFEASLRTQAKRLFPNGKFNPLTIKMGDEIGAVAGTADINGLETCRRVFHDYLRARLKDISQDVSFFGVESIEELPYIDHIGPHSGLYERRLYYHSTRFKFVLTAMYYGQITRAAERVFPEVYTYCNFSPHPPMFGQQMNHSDWFTLTRELGANTAWGEGWASGGGWGFVGHEVVSYYGAWVECAARRHNQPSGFYIVGTMGGADKKMFSLVARGIDQIYLYAWGPRYIGAEGSNFWSENKNIYYEIARGTHALGPADEIIAEGNRRQSRVALLYNRSHEIWNGAYGGLQSDRLLTFMALTHAHIPTDIILEEDLSDESLAQYKVLYLQGFNLGRKHLAAVRRWVEKGGTLIGVAGTAIRDTYNNPTDEAEKLFGAKQQLAGTSKGGWHPQALPKHEPIDSLKLKLSDLTPDLTLDVIGIKANLQPTTGKSVGTFSDGTCGAALNTIGQGKTLLLGITPGHIYKGKSGGSSRYSLDLRPLIALPAERTLGEQDVTYSEPQTEICRFDHKTGIAITLSNFAHFQEPKERDVELTVKTDRKITRVTSSLKGSLEWSREGGSVKVKLKSPQPVDVVVLRAGP